MRLGKYYELLWQITFPFSLLRVSFVCLHVWKCDQKRTHTILYFLALSRIYTILYFTCSEQNIYNIIFPCSEQNIYNIIFTFSEQNIYNIIFPCSEQNIYNIIFTCSEQNIYNIIFSCSEQNIYVILYLLVLSRIYTILYFLALSKINNDVFKIHIPLVIYSRIKMLLNVTETFYSRQFNRVKRTSYRRWSTGNTCHIISVASASNRNNSAISVTSEEIAEGFRLIRQATFDKPRD